MHLRLFANRKKNPTQKKRKKTIYENKEQIKNNESKIAINPMPHITFFTTIQLLCYYLQIESISAMITIIIATSSATMKKKEKNEPASTIPIEFQNCNRRHCFPLENFQIQSLFHNLYLQLSLSISFSCFVYSRSLLALLCPFFSVCLSLSI